LAKRFTPFLIVFFAFAVMLLLSFVPTEFSLLNHNFRKVDITTQLKEVFFHKEVGKKVDLQSEDTIKVPHISVDSLLALTLKINLDSILEQEKNDLRISSFSDNSILFSRFFPALRSVRDSSSKTRIAYFGDSMIEGDLISQPLRNELQNRMGGWGVGFVPITSIVSQFRRSIKHEFSNDWKAYSIQKGKELKNFALSGFVFNPVVLTHNELKDTVTMQRVSYVRYAAPVDTYKRLSRFYDTKLYFGKASRDSYIKYYLDGKLYKTKLLGQNDVNELVLNKIVPYKELLIEFFTDSILDVYGVSFESPKGVFVDNYAVRGNSGIPLHKIPENIMKGFNNYMNYSLLIFQFGLNVASPDAKGFRWYEDAMVKVVDYYKKIIPGADILVISVGDKSYKYDMEYVTQPGIPKLVESQRNIAKRTKSNFWNLYQSMGGYNSMKSWVETPKPLASKDYAHINFLGAEKISKLLSDNIINEYTFYEYTFLKDKEKQQLFDAILNSNTYLSENFISFEKQYTFLAKDKQKIKLPQNTTSIAKSLLANEIKNDSIVATNQDTLTDTYEYRVQIGASKDELDMHTYDNILKRAKGKKLRRIKHMDGYYRYYIAPYMSFDLAQAFADSVLPEINDAFVVGFINGERAKIELVKKKQLEIERKKQNQHKEIVAKAEASKPLIKTGNNSVPKPKYIELKKYPKPLKALNFVDVHSGNIVPRDTQNDYVFRLKKVDNAVNKITGIVEMPVFRVLFCASEVELEKTFYQNIIDYFGDSLIIISKDKDGLIRYMLGNYKTYKEAEQALSKVLELKQDGYITAYQHNRRIKTEEAISIINKKKK